MYAQYLPERVSVIFCLCFAIFSQWLWLKTLSIRSCLKICISQKIIFSFLGYKTVIINGIKQSSDNSVKGHAWIEIDDRPITHIDDDISGYSKSFII